MRDILRDGTARNTFGQPGCAGCEDEAGESQTTKLYQAIWVCQVSAKSAQESLTGPADFESIFWGSPK